MTAGTRTALAVVALGLLGACEPGAPGTVASDPMAAANDTVAAETEADDPMQPGAIDDTPGTTIPGE